MPREERERSWREWLLLALLTGAFGSLCKAIHSNPYA
jgi:hypothetical protein